MTTDTTTPADERKAFEAWFGALEEAPWYEGIRYAIAWAAWQARAASQPAKLTAQQLDALIERHCGGTELTDGEYSSMVMFAASVERAHGIGADSAASQPAQEPVKYGCHIDIDAMPEGFQPDECVIDTGKLEDCIYAKKYGDKGRDHCGEWRPIKVVAPPADTARQDRIVDLLREARYYVQRQSDECVGACDEDSSKCCADTLRRIDTALEAEVRKPA